MRGVRDWVSLLLLALFSAFGSARSQVPTVDSGAEQQIIFLDTPGHEVLLSRQLVSLTFWGRFGMV